MKKPAESSNGAGLNGAGLGLLPAGAYLRISNEKRGVGDKDRENYSPKAQLATAMMTAQTEGYYILKTYKDIHTGSDYEEREGLQEALRDLEAGTIKALIFARVDRHSRNRLHQSLIEQRVSRAGGKLIFCDVPESHTPQGKLLKNILGDFADFERQLIRLRLMEGKKMMATGSDGLPPLQPQRASSPFAYKIVTKKDVLAGKADAALAGQYQILDERAPIITHFFEGYANSETLGSLSQWVYEEHGLRMDRAKISEILRNPVYKGQARFNAEITLEDEGRRQRGLKSKTYKVRNPDPNSIKYIPVPAIVSEELWNKVQAKLKENQSLRSGRPQRRRLLTGLLRCPHCGSKLQYVGFRYRKGKKDKKSDGQKSKGKERPLGEHYYHYVCRKRYRFARNDPEKKCPQGFAIAATIIEPLVIEKVLECLNDPDALEEALKAQQENNQNPSNPSELSTLTRRIERLEKSFEAAVKGQMRALELDVDVSIHEKKLVEIQAELKPLLAKRAELQRASVSIPDSAIKAQVQTIQDSFQDVADVLRDSEVAASEKNKHLISLISSIVPRREKRRVALPPVITWRVE